MDERKAAIQEWKRVQPKRILLGVALTAAVVLALWLAVGRETTPAPAAPVTPEVTSDLDGGVETTLLWKQAEGIADFSGAIVDADLGAGTVTLDLRAKAAEGAELTQFQVRNSWDDEGVDRFTPQAADGSCRALCTVPLAEDLEVALVVDGQAVPAQRWSGALSYYLPTPEARFDGEWQGDEETGEVTIRGTVTVDLRWQGGPPLAHMAPTSVTALLSAPGYQRDSVSAQWEGDVLDSLPVEIPVEFQATLDYGEQLYIEGAAGWRWEGRGTSCGDVPLSIYRNIDGAFQAHEN